MVPIILIFGSLALVILFPSISCRTGIKDAAGSPQFSDSFHSVFDCGCSSHQEVQHITWEMSARGFNNISGPKMALTFLDLYGNSTPTALSGQSNVVCDLISYRRVLVIICTLNGNYESSWIAGMDDFITKVPTPCGEPVLPKAKLETASSVSYMIRHTTKKVSCFSAVVGSIKYWQNAFNEDIKFHRAHIDSVTLNLTFCATDSRMQKLWGLIETDEASLSTTLSFPLQGACSDDIVFKSAFVGTGYTFGGNYRRQGYSFRHAGKAVLRIGVPVRSNITQFVSVSNNENHTTHITGFSIDVFEAAVRRLPYKFTYKLIPFIGTSDELVRMVARKAFDVGVGDIITTAGQDLPVEFSLPYLKPAFTWVVKAKTNQVNDFWWFLSPFTSGMWVMIATFSALIGAVIWIIEGQDEDGPNFLEALFFVQRRPLQNNIARILRVLWMFVLLIFTQVYTNILTTMLTNSQRGPSISDVESLKWTNHSIGCDGQSQTMSYLVKVLGLKQSNIRIIASIDGYKKALSHGYISAAFLLTPYAKVLLAKHCADFTEIKPTYGYNLGGFGFVFPKGSPIASDISAAILELKVSGELQLMEEKMSSFSDCSTKLFDDASIPAIGPSSFLGLFVICGVSLAIALLIILMKLLDRHWEERIRRMLIGRELWPWLVRLLHIVFMARVLRRPRRVGLRRL